MKLNLWLLGISSAGTVCFIAFINGKINKWIEKQILKKKKENGLDVLNQNCLLTFGLSQQQCEGHMNREFDCKNLDCNYGRLCHILNYINSCEETLDVCIYIITAKLFGDCIINAHKRGIKVRVIADGDMSFSAQSLVNAFRAEEIPTRQRMSPYIMHHKFVIVDNEVLINGSMNFTMTGAFCNWENVMITTQPNLVKSFQQAFDNLWDNFSPDKFEFDSINRSSMLEHQGAYL